MRRGEQIKDSSYGVYGTESVCDSLSVLYSGRTSLPLPHSKPALMEPTTISRFIRRTNDQKTCNICMLLIRYLGNFFLAETGHYRIFVATIIVR